MVRKVNNWAEFNAELKAAGNKLVVVDFTATWCGPCRKISPIFNNLANESANKDVIFLKVDVDEADDVSQKFEISCMPTFQFYKNGEMVFEFSGAYLATLKSKLEELR